jgi:hypothetical protein
VKDGATFFALMMTTDWRTAAAAEARGIGTYVIGEATNGVGIRTYPYTVDMTVNPYTYADVAHTALRSKSLNWYDLGDRYCGKWYGVLCRTPARSGYVSWNGRKKCRDATGHRWTETCSPAVPGLWMAVMLYSLQID